MDVLANGNLVILGEKELTLTEGSEVIRVKGLVRPEDIQPNNTVLSHRIASAQISTAVPVTWREAIKPGWGARFCSAYGHSEMRLMKSVKHFSLVSTVCVLVMTSVTASPQSVSRIWPIWVVYAVISWSATGWWPVCPVVVMAEIC